MSLLGNLFHKKITPEMLKKALKNNEFVFYYQPEFDLKTGKVLGVEALMRWVNNRRGIVPPADFIPVLEQSGVINDFTDTLLKTTLSDLHKLHEAGFRDLHVAVNFSVNQLKQPNIAEQIQSALQGAHIPANFLECEVTETQDIDRELLESETFKKLEALNVSRVIDYFVCHNFVLNYDSYIGSMLHNYYLFETDGLLEMIPWDYNLAFGTFRGGENGSTTDLVNRGIDTPLSGSSEEDRPMWSFIVNDENYLNYYDDY